MSNEDIIIHSYSTVEKSSLGLAHIPASLLAPEHCVIMNSERCLVPLLELQVLSDRSI